MTDAELEDPVITPLVKALTRAPTLMGVPYMYFMLNGVVTSVLRDDRIFEILFVKSAKCPPRSRSFWGADSYRV